MTDRTLTPTEHLATAITDAVTSASPEGVLGESTIAALREAIDATSPMQRARILRGVNYMRDLALDDEHVREFGALTTIATMLSA